MGYAQIKSHYWFASPSNRQGNNSALKVQLWDMKDAEMRKKVARRSIEGTDYHHVYNNVEKSLPDDIAVWGVTVPGWVALHIVAYVKQIQMTFVRLLPQSDE